MGKGGRTPPRPDPIRPDFVVGSDRIGSGRCTVVKNSVGHDREQSGTIGVSLNMFRIFQQNRVESDRIGSVYDSQSAD